MSSSHRTAHRSATPRRRQSSALLLAGILSVTLGLLMLAGLRWVPGSPLYASSKPGWAPTTGTTSAAPKPSPSRTLKPLIIDPAATVEIDDAGWVAWSVLDRRTGKFYGSKNMTSTSTSASLVKAWIASDYLRRATEAGETPNETRMHQLTIMIRDSDNDAAIALWNALGKGSSGTRMIETCGLTESKTNSNWSLVRFSPRDIARLGGCIADGRAAGPKWTKWLLNEMRQVRGVGDFGIRKAFPKTVAKTIAIKNGWVIRDESFEWHINCLAIGDGWTMGVTTRFSTKYPYTHGADICESIASQLRVRSSSPSPSA